MISRCLFLLGALALLSTSISYAQDLPPVVVSYTYTGTLQSFTVPAGVSSLFVELWGAGGQGGDGGGGGGYVRGYLSVRQGETLTVLVGGLASGGVGGFGGGQPPFGGGQSFLSTAIPGIVLSAGGGGGGLGGNGGGGTPGLFGKGGDGRRYSYPFVGTGGGNSIDTVAVSNYAFDSGDDLGNPGGIDGRVRPWSWVGPFGFGWSTPGGAVRNACPGLVLITYNPLDPPTTIAAVTLPRATVTRSGGVLSVTIPIKDTGTADAFGVRITSAMMGTTRTTTTLPVVLAKISSGSTSGVTFTFPVSAAPAGTSPFVTLNYNSNNAGTGSLSVRCAPVP